MKPLPLAAAAMLFCVGATQPPAAIPPPPPGPPSPATEVPADPQSVKECMLCSDGLKKALKSCDARAGDARERCRAEARSKADGCAKQKVGNCNLDLIMEEPALEGPNAPGDGKPPPERAH